MIIPEGYGIKFLKNTPHTFKGAYPTAFRRVENKRVIKIQEAKYRNSVFDGIFELEDQAGDIEFLGYKGFRCKIICFWFFRRPETVWPGVLFKEKHYEIIENYTGEVALNICVPGFRP